MEGSGDIPDICTPEVGQPATCIWSKNTKEQVHLKQKIKDLPALLKHGLQLRKKTAETIMVPDTTLGPGTGISRWKACSQSFPCAGRALRNAFLATSPQPAKDQIQLARIIRRSYVGLELVEWILKQCLFIQCRVVAAGVWQILLELGILFSVDQSNVFEDANSYYQFSYEECDIKDCHFRNEQEWHSGVQLLMQLVPYVQFRIAVIDQPEKEMEDKKQFCNEVLQMKALERLTSTVQNELAAALARKARKSLALEEERSDSVEAVPDELINSTNKDKPGAVCTLHDRDDISRIEMVQRLAKNSCRFLQIPNNTAPDKTFENDEVSRVCLKERGRDVLVLQSVSSECQAPPASAGGGREEEKDRRYVVVSGTPEKILEHLLSDLRLDESQGPQGKETETLLDDFLLTYMVFMTTSDLCQALLRHYCSKRYRGKEETSDALFRKRKVLHLVSQWTALYRDVLREDEQVKLFIKTLYRYVLDDLYEYPTLEKDLTEFQKLLRIHRRHTVDEYSPHRKSKALFHQFSLKENWLQHREAHNETKEVFCRVYITNHSYLSIMTSLSATAQEVLKTVAEKMGYAEEELALVTVTFPGEKHILQPHDTVNSESLTTSGRLLVCWKDLSEILNPFTDNEEMQHRAVRMLGMNTWDLALALTNFDWNLFNAIHEQELIYYTFSRQGSGRNTVSLDLLLQRCNEVQLWVMTEILLCSLLCKRVQLVKKFIKIAAHCRAQRNVNSFFAIIMGLNNAAVSRLSQTWEKVPGKFRKLFSELETLTDPSLNHKAYRDAFRKMKPPKIPFMPLLLKDITFIHEGNKTFLDNLVNFEKLHMIADTVRFIRHCRTDQLGHDGPQKDQQDVKTFVHHLHVIDNQQTLFGLSLSLEPRM
ncbi:rap guanine nucleotide exchange factor 5-like isoform X2 [Polyodon spathula]|uniref:rap guanine nucleotide exchange factor 5-like isoform X2 n=1 Tax=Polyodon spathula TaxID=7913 RepID=UPI001B7E2A8E|nr:rap guanine nucleotide exchange factor 5-like isoform X2 [Polyodon spathula]